MDEQLQLVETITEGLVKCRVWKSYLYDASAKTCGSGYEVELDYPSFGNRLIEAELQDAVRALQRASAYVQQRFDEYGMDLEETPIVGAAV